MNQAQSSTLSPAARRVARTMLNGFESYFAEYQNITLGAKKRRLEGKRQTSVAKRLRGRVRSED